MQEESLATIQEVWYDEDKCFCNRGTYLMKTWVISPADNATHTAEECWSALKMCATELRDCTTLLTDLALELGAPSRDEDGETLYEYASRFMDRQDQRLQVIEPEDPAWGESAPCIVLNASGSGLSRRMKEGLHRAFLRLLIRWMHGQDLDISVSV